jgi:hypothetical protein
MCNLYSLTKGQAAIRDWFRARNDRTGNLPLFPGIFPDQVAPIVRVGPDGERELVMARWGMPGPPQFGGQPVTNIRNLSSPNPAHNRAGSVRSHATTPPASPLHPPGQDVPTAALSKRSEERQVRPRDLSMTRDELVALRDTIDTMPSWPDSIRDHRETAPCERE